MQQPAPPQPGGALAAPVGYWQGAGTFPALPSAPALPPLAAAAPPGPKPRRPGKLQPLRLGQRPTPAASRQQAATAALAAAHSRHLGAEPLPASQPAQPVQQLACLLPPLAASGAAAWADPPQQLQPPWAPPHHHYPLAPPQLPWGQQVPYGWARTWGWGAPAGTGGASGAIPPLPHSYHQALPPLPHYPLPQHNLHGA